MGAREAAGSSQPGRADLPGLDPLPRRVGFWGASAVMLGIIIGSGIFRTPPVIAEQLASPALILALWVAGGALALLGALTYAELACMYPESGGVYVFIREGYGQAMAFVFGWTYLLITKPFAAAGIAVIFGEHLNRLLGTDFDPPLLTCAVIIALTAVNAWGVRLSTGLAMVLTSLKLGALVAIVALAWWFGRIGPEALAPAAAIAPAPAAPGDGAALAGAAEAPSLWLALVPVMAAILWTYDGWSDVGAIAGEVKDPRRVLPRIYFTGTAVITLVYVLVNLAYFGVVPIGEMRGMETVAPTVAERLISGAGVVVTAIVVVSTMGSTHGSIMTGARVTFAQARDGLMFRFLGRVAPRRQTPAVALWVQCLLSCVAALGLREFTQLADGFVFSMWIFYGLAGGAIFILRVRRPDAPRAYRCWGYPVVPLVFVLAAAAMTVLSICQRPEMTLRWLAVLMAGFPVYYLWRRVSPGRADGAITPDQDRPEHPPAGRA
ncbi:MAG: APC family permease [Phycisphaerales bacterium]